MDVSNNLLSRVESIAEAALLHEAMGRRGALSHDIKPVFPGAKVCGRALTVRGCPGDNLMLHIAIAKAKPGDVLIVTVDGYLEAGGWGEIASLAAQLRGVRGLVLDGSVRDVEAIARLKFPVFARGVSIKGTTKRQRGELNQPITIGGVYVRPGDVVVGDADGVVVVPVEEVDPVVAKAAEIKTREEGIMQQLREGKTTLEILRLESVIKELVLDQ